MFAFARYATVLAILVGLTACDPFKKQPDAVVAAGAYAAFLGCASFNTYDSSVHRILIDRCYSCHQTESGFLLNRRDTGHDYAETLQELLENDYFNPTLNPLLKKATGGDNHVGGEVLRELDDDYATIVEWIIEERDTPCPAAIYSTDHF